MAEFHFLRPWWLLAVVPAGALTWRLWATEDAGRAWRKLVAPHLLPHLLTGREERGWFRPVTVLLVGWVLATIALAGPTWAREPAPFAEDTAVLAIVVKVTPSMKAEDVQPNRLARATEKVRDLLKLRPGTRTALFAYAGSAHRVMPLTTDAGIVTTFAAELSPDVMPVEGANASAALTAADETVKKSGRAGWVLWIADGVSPDEQKALEKYHAEGRAPVSVLAVAGEGPELESLKQAASVLDAPVVRVSPDNADVQRLSRNTRFSTVSEQAGGERWKDFGYWLVFPLALVALLSFRRGWMVRSAGGEA
ncbi:Tetratricopeptide TPR_4 OS=Cyanothece sp. CCY0110 GN=CY0110_28164 PE=4 SV=1: VWA_2 [Gemmata massiliana]|uniref:VWFA domain-containing protein n=1 Tax=Gemmata massiliana TaxID=1210884 RepID=A0A6P2CQU9_9BACT|nr:VWA domain-containing protein [Gemmata massiliana]VTR91239.1 Tetratricopeptide TPR_4 OS=Cyanothece sp. CCY0110 GN=CY0110_28164 PE=4 SV=1: VWA_2 [Gemmata massiliana]